jgi:hypothetical protein
MSPPTLGRVLRQLRRPAAPDEAGEPTDADLVDRFVRRHGAMVLGASAGAG